MKEWEGAQQKRILSITHKQKRAIQRAQTRRTIERIQRAQTKKESRTIFIISNKPVYCNYCGNELSRKDDERISQSHNHIMDCGKKTYKKKFNAIQIENHGDIVCCMKKWRKSGVI